MRTNNLQLLQAKTPKTSHVAASQALPHIGPSRACAQYGFIRENAVTPATLQQFVLKNATLRSNLQVIRLRQPLYPPSKTLSYQRESIPEIPTTPVTGSEACDVK